MTIFDPADARWRERMLSVLRIVAAFIYLQHGLQKAFGYPPMPAGMGGGPAQLLSIQGLAMLIETIGGTAILLGIFTRPFAFLCAGEMAVAYFWKHNPHSFWPVVNHGEPAVLLCFVFLYFVFAGAGSISIDALIRRYRFGQAERVVRR